MNQQREWMSNPGQVRVSSASLLPPSEQVALAWAVDVAEATVNKAAERIDSSYSQSQLAKDQLRLAAARQALALIQLPVPGKRRAWGVTLDLFVESAAILFLGVMATLAILWTVGAL